MTNQNRTPSTPNDMDKKDVRKNADKSQKRGDDASLDRDEDSAVSRGNPSERKGSEDRSSQNW